MDLSGASPWRKDAAHGGVSLFETASMEKPTCARCMRSFGRRPESGYKSATNLSMKSDSDLFSDSEDGFSGTDLGDPYTRAGTCQLRNSDTDKGNLERRATE